MDIQELKDIIQKFEDIKSRIGSEPTIFELLGYKETDITKILRFFLDTNKPHRLNNLVLISLMNCYLKKDDSRELHNTPEFKKTERVFNNDYTTKQGNRLDILVEGSDFVIGIENKLYAALYNDLADYGESINQFAGNKETFKVVLSMNQTDINQDTNFINITYSELIKEIYFNLHNYIYQANPKYLLLLTDLLQTLEPYNIMENNQDFINFLKERDTIIRDLIANRNRSCEIIENDFTKKVQSFASENENVRFNYRTSQTKADDYLKSYTYDISYDNQVLSFHCYINPDKCAIFEYKNKKATGQNHTGNIDSSLEFIGMRTQYFINRVA